MLKGKSSGLGYISRAVTNCMHGRMCVPEKVEGKKIIYIPLRVTKNRSLVAGKKIPREGIEEESKFHTYDRPPPLHLCK